MKKRSRKAEELENVLLLQDNAPAHTADRTGLELDVLRFGRVRHPPYSPDLAPLDFSLFPRIKSELRGIRLENLEHLKQEVSRVIASLDTKWFRDAFSAWVHRHERCVAAAGHYFEKE